MHNPILRTGDLGFPWTTQDPFLFCVYHHDKYPAGNENLGPVDDISARDLGSDFTIKDGYRMYHGTKVPGFQAHPHRGFETITIAEKGLVDHADSLGATGRFGEGDVQWMTAGKGVQHSEMFPLLNSKATNELLLFQIWINLPAKSKMVDAHYKMLWHEKLPVEKKEGVKIKLVFGDFAGLTQLVAAPDSWAMEKDSEVAVVIMELEPGAEFLLPEQNEGINRSIFFYEGVDVSIAEQDFERHSYFELKAGVNCNISSKKGAKLMLLQGKPIDEPVVQHGPFVMNSDSEIRETMRDFGKTQFGGWPWPSLDFVHERGKGRFAQYANGEIEIPA